MAPDYPIWGFPARTSAQEDTITMADLSTVLWNLWKNCKASGSAGTKGTAGYEK